MDEISSRYVQMACGAQSQLHNPLEVVQFTDQVQAMIERSSAPRKNFLIDSTTAHGDAVVTESSVRKPGIGWITLQVTEGIRRGVHEWCVKIENQGETTDGSGLMLGIVPKSFNKYDSFISTGGGWCLSRAGKLYGHWRRTDSGPSAFSFGTGDRVIFLLDYEASRFVVRAGDKCIVGEISNLNTEVFPAVSLHYRNQHVRFEYHIVHDRNAKQLNWIERGVFPFAAAFLPLTADQLRLLPLDSYVFSSLLVDRPTELKEVVNPGSRRQTRRAPRPSPGSQLSPLNTGTVSLAAAGSSSSPSSPRRTPPPALDNNALLLVEGDDDDDDDAMDTASSTSSFGDLSSAALGMNGGDSSADVVMTDEERAAAYASLEAASARIRVLQHAFEAVSRSRSATASAELFLSKDVPAEVVRSRFYETLRQTAPVRGTSNYASPSRSGQYDATMNWGAVVVVQLFSTLSRQDGGEWPLEMAKTVAKYVLSQPLFALAESNAASAAISPEVLQLAIDNVFHTLTSSSGSGSGTAGTSAVPPLSSLVAAASAANGSESTPQRSEELTELRATLLELATVLGLQRGMVSEVLHACRLLLRYPRSTASPQLMQWLRRHAQGLRPDPVFPNIVTWLNVVRQSCNRFPATTMGRDHVVLSVGYGTGGCVYVHTSTGLSKWVNNGTRYMMHHHTNRPTPYCTEVSSSSMAVTSTHVLLLTDKMLPASVAVVAYNAVLEVQRVYALNEMGSDWPRTAPTSSPLLCGATQDQFLLVYHRGGGTGNSEPANATSAPVEAAGADGAEMEVQGFSLASFPTPLFTQTLRPPRPNSSTLRHCIVVPKRCRIDLGQPDELLQAPGGRVTVELWVMLLAKEDAALLYQHGDKFTSGEVFLETALLEGAFSIRGGYRHDVRGACVVSAPLPPVTEGRFVHIALVCDGVWRLYMDGEEVTNNHLGPHVSLESPKQRWIVAENCACWLAGVRVWRTARGARELQRDSGRVLRGDEPGLVCQLACNECGGDVVFNYVNDPKACHARCVGFFERVRCDQHPWRPLQDTDLVAPYHVELPSLSDLTGARGFVSGSQLVLSTTVSESAPIVRPSGRLFAAYDLKTGVASPALYMLPSVSCYKGMIGTDGAGQLWELYDKAVESMETVDPASPTAHADGVLAVAPMPAQPAVFLFSSLSVTAPSAATPSAPHRRSTGAENAPFTTLAAAGVCGVSTERAGANAAEALRAAISRPTGGDCGGNVKAISLSSGGGGGAPPPPLTTAATIDSEHFSGGSAVSFASLGLWLLQLLSQHAEEEPPAARRELFMPLADDVGRRCAMEVKATMQEHFRVVKGPNGRRAIALLKGDQSKVVVAATLQVLLRLLRRVRDFAIHPSSIGLNALDGRGDAELAMVLKELCTPSPLRRRESSSFSRALSANGAGNIAGGAAGSPVEVPSPPSHHVANSGRGPGSSATSACGDDARPTPRPGSGSTGTNSASNSSFVVTVPAATTTTTPPSASSPSTAAETGGVLLGLLGDVINEAGTTLPNELGQLARTALMEGIELFIPSVRGRARLLRDVLTTPSPSTAVMGERVPAVEVLLEAVVCSLSTVSKAAPLLAPPSPSSSASSIATDGVAGGSAPVSANPGDGDHGSAGEDEALTELRKTLAVLIEESLVQMRHQQHTLQAAVLESAAQAAAPSPTASVAVGVDSQSASQPHSLGAATLPPPSRLITSLSETISALQMLLLSACRSTDLPAADAALTAAGGAPKPPGPGTGTSTSATADLLFSAPRRTEHAACVHAYYDALFSAVQKTLRVFFPTAPAAGAGSSPPQAAAAARTRTSASPTRSGASTCAHATAVPRTSTTSPQRGRGTTGSLAGPLAAESGDGKSAKAIPQAATTTTTAGAASAPSMLCAGSPGAVPRGVVTVMRTPPPVPASSSSSTPPPPPVTSTTAAAASLSTSPASLIATLEAIRHSFVAAPLHTAISAIPLVLTVEDAPWFMEQLEALLPLTEALRDARRQVQALRSCPEYHATLLLLEDTPVDALHSAVLFALTWIAVFMTQCTSITESAPLAKATPTPETAASSVTCTVEQLQQASDYCDAPQMRGGVLPSTFAPLSPSSKAKSATTVCGTDSVSSATHSPRSATRTTSSVATSQPSTTAAPVPPAEPSATGNTSPRQRSAKAAEAKSDSTAAGRTRRHVALSLLEGAQLAKWAAVQSKLDALGARVPTELATLLSTAAVTILYLSNAPSLHALRPERLESMMRGILQRLSPERNELLHRSAGGTAADKAAFKAHLAELTARCRFLLEHVVAPFEMSSLGDPMYTTGWVFAGKKTASRGAASHPLSPAVDDAEDAVAGGGGGGDAVYEVRHVRLGSGLTAANGNALIPMDDNGASWCVSPHSPHFPRPPRERWQWAISAVRRQLLLHRADVVTNDQLSLRATTQFVVRLIRSDTITLAALRQTCKRRARLAQVRRQGLQQLLHLILREPSSAESVALLLSGGSAGRQMYYESGLGGCSSEDLVQVRATLYSLVEWLQWYQQQQQRLAASSVAHGSAISASHISPAKSKRTSGGGGAVSSPQSAVPAIASSSSPAAAAAAGRRTASASPPSAAGPPPPSTPYAGIAAAASAAATLPPALLCDVVNRAWRPQDFSFFCALRLAESIFSAHCSPFLPSVKPPTSSSSSVPASSRSSSSAAATSSVAAVAARAGGGTGTVAAGSTTASPSAAPPAGATATAPSDLTFGIPAPSATMPMMREESPAERAHREEVHAFQRTLATRVGPTAVSSPSAGGGSGGSGGGADGTAEAQYLRTANERAERRALSCLKTLAMQCATWLSQPALSYAQELGCVTFLQQLFHVLHGELKRSMDGLRAVDAVVTGSPSGSPSTLQLGSRLISHVRLLLSFVATVVAVLPPSLRFPAALAKAATPVALQLCHFAFFRVHEAVPMGGATALRVAARLLRHCDPAVANAIVADDALAEGIVKVYKTVFERHNAALSLVVVLAQHQMMQYGLSTTAVHAAYAARTLLQNRSWAALLDTISISFKVVVDAVASTAPGLSRVQRATNAMRLLAWAGVLGGELLYTPGTGLPLRQKAEDGNAEQTVYVVEVPDDADRDAVGRRQEPLRSDALVTVVTADLSAMPPIVLPAIPSADPVAERRAKAAEQATHTGTKDEQDGDDAAKRASRPVIPNLTEDRRVSPEVLLLPDVSNLSETPPFDLLHREYVHCVLNALLADNHPGLFQPVEVMALNSVLQLAMQLTRRTPTDCATLLTGKVLYRINHLASKVKPRFPLPTIIAREYAAHAGRYLLDATRLHTTFSVTGSSSDTTSDRATDVSEFNVSPGVASLSPGSGRHTATPSPMVSAGPSRTLDRSAAPGSSLNAMLAHFAREGRGTHVSLAALTHGMGGVGGAPRVSTVQELSTPTTLCLLVAQEMARTTIPASITLTAIGAMTGGKDSAAPGEGATKKEKAEEAEKKEGNPETAKGAQAPPQQQQQAKDALTSTPTIQVTRGDAAGGASATRTPPLGDAGQRRRWGGGFPTWTDGFSFDVHVMLCDTLFPPLGEDYTVSRSSGEWGRPRLFVDLVSVFTMEAGEDPSSVRPLLQLSLAGNVVRLCVHPVPVSDAESASTKASAAVGTGGADDLVVTMPLKNEDWDTYIHMGLVMDHHSISIVKGGDLATARLPASLAVQLESVLRCERKVTHVVLGDSPFTQQNSPTGRTASDVIVTDPALVYFNTFRLWGSSSTSTAKVGDTRSAATDVAGLMGELLEGATTPSNKDPSSTGATTVTDDSPCVFAFREGSGGVVYSSTKAFVGRLDGAVRWSPPPQTVRPVGLIDRNEILYTGTRPTLPWWVPRNEVATFFATLDPAGIERVGGDVMWTITAFLTRQTIISALQQTLSPRYELYLREHPVLEMPTAVKGRPAEVIKYCPFNPFLIFDDNAVIAEVVNLFRFNDVGVLFDEDADLLDRLFTCLLAFLASVPSRCAAAAKIFRELSSVVADMLRDDSGETFLIEIPGCITNNVRGSAAIPVLPLLLINGCAGLISIDGPGSGIEQAQIYKDRQQKNVIAKFPDGQGGWPECHIQQDLPWFFVRLVTPGRTPPLRSSDPAAPAITNASFTAAVKSLRPITLRVVLASFTRFLTTHTNCHVLEPALHAILNARMLVSFTTRRSRALHDDYAHVYGMLSSLMQLWTYYPHIQPFDRTPLHVLLAHVSAPLVELIHRGYPELKDLANSLRAPPIGTFNSFVQALFNVLLTALQLESAWNGSLYVARVRERFRLIQNMWSCATGFTPPSESRTVAATVGVAPPPHVVEARHVSSSAPTSEVRPPFTPTRPSTAGSPTTRGGAVPPPVGGPGGGTVNLLRPPLITSAAADNSVSRGGASHSSGSRGSTSVHNNLSGSLKVQDGTAVRWLPQPYAFPPPLATVAEPYLNGFVTLVILSPMSELMNNGMSCEVTSPRPPPPAPTPPKVAVWRKGNGTWRVQCDRGQVVVSTAFGFTRGRFYFEVTLPAGYAANAGTLTVGVRTAASRAHESPEGLGSDGESWGFDLVRQFRFHQGYRTDFPARGRFKGGDVVGILLDVEQEKLLCQHNDRQVSMFDRLSPSREGNSGTSDTSNPSTGPVYYFPTITFGALGCEINMGSAPFSGTLPTGFLPVDPKHYCNGAATTMWRMMTALELGATLTVAQQPREPPMMSDVYTSKAVDSMATVARRVGPARRRRRRSSSTQAIGGVGTEPSHGENNQVLHPVLYALQKHLQPYCEGRNGPVSVELLYPNPRAKVSGNRVKAEEGMAFVRGGVSVCRGRWYFEVVVRDEAAVSIGWVLSHVETDFSLWRGLGDDKNSWAVETRRMVAKHDGRQLNLGRPSARDGDVVGCLLDCESCSMGFSVNGSMQRVANQGENPSGSTMLFSAIGCQPTETPAGSPNAGDGSSRANSEASSSAAAMGSPHSSGHSASGQATKQQQQQPPLMHYTPVVLVETRSAATVHFAAENMVYMPTPFKALGAAGAVYDAYVYHYLLQSETEMLEQYSNGSFCPRHHLPPTLVQAGGVRPPHTVSLQPAPTYHALQKGVRWLTASVDLSPTTLTAYTLQTFSGQNMVSVPTHVIDADSGDVSDEGSTHTNNSDGSGGGGNKERSVEEVLRGAIGGEIIIPGMNMAQSAQLFTYLMGLSHAVDSLHDFAHSGMLPVDIDVDTPYLSPLALALQELRRVCLPSTSLPMLRRALLGTTTSPEALKLTLNRRKALAMMQDPTLTPATRLRDSIFGQIYQLLSSKGALLYCTTKKLWNVVFLGEGADDVGGPYRETLSNLCAELMSASLPLFLPSPNQVAELGNAREVFVLHPDARPPVELAMYQFLGRLMGGCLRSAEPLALYLPSAVWKAITGDIATLDDLDQTDLATVRALRCILSTGARYAAKGGRSDDPASTALIEKGKEELQELCPGGFVVQDDAGVYHELIPGGRTIPVTPYNVVDYVRLVLCFKLKDMAAAQRNALVTGFREVVPACMVSGLKWYELEELVCGQHDYDADALLDNARYDQLEPTDSRVVFLRQVLREFTRQQRALFMRFVSGRERLPPGIRLRIMADSSTAPAAAAATATTGPSGGGAARHGPDSTPTPTRANTSTNGPTASPPFPPPQPGRRPSAGVSASGSPAPARGPTTEPSSSSAPSDGARNGRPTPSGSNAQPQAWPPAPAGGRLPAPPVPPAPPSVLQRRGEGQLNLSSTLGSASTGSTVNSSRRPSGDQPQPQSTGSSLPSPRRPAPTITTVTEVPSHIGAEGRGTSSVASAGASATSLASPLSTPRRDSVGGFDDDRLPHASTCFYWLSLPRYSSVEVLRARLLFAIEQCMDIDADFRVHDEDSGDWREEGPAVQRANRDEDDDEFEDFSQLR